MFDSLQINGFRCFRDFSVRNLSRINLFVGLNNSGKTSILEAINTLVRFGDPAALEGFMSRRQESLAVAQDGFGRPFRELDLRRLFAGHSIEAGSRFSIDALESEGNRRVQFEVVESTSPNAITTTAIDATQSSSTLHGFPVTPTIAVRIEGERSRNQYGRRTEIRLSKNGNLDPDSAFPEKATEAFDPVQFVFVDSISSSLAEGWSEIALTPHEDTVVDSLSLLEPNLERIGYVREAHTEAGAFRVKLSDNSQPVPIGSMGQGMSRMLNLVVALVRCRNGFLLVDEIDTGLHHTVISDVWRIVLKTAERLNIQVFATTHSWDCIKGLAAICDAGDDRPQRVAMHRIERDKSESVHYSERQIVIAADRGIETR